MPDDGLMVRRDSLDCASKSQTQLDLLDSQLRDYDGDCYSDFRYRETPELRGGSEMSGTGG